MPDTIDNRIRFKISSPPLPSMEGIQQLEQFKHWLQSKRYSENTIKTYSEALQSFLTFFNQKSVFEIT
ncbi:phage integrase N-terminal SAM-like domain-containing protein, partial [Flavobacterium jumunjinense]